jgi:predicted ATPase/DNA-binding CsgD family transcriptional regulator
LAWTVVRSANGLAPARNLPAGPTPLIGRASELVLASQRLLRPDVRLLTLVGPGGTGKTRLALQLAADLDGAFAHGVHFVDLTPLRDPLLVLPLVGRSLGALGGGSRSIPEALGRLLGDGSLLLVLDNFEQVLASARDVSDLLQHAPGLKVLVTSREPLGLRWEHALPIQPLALPAAGVRHSAAELLAVPSVALFLQRVQAVRPDFALSEENAEAVAEVCRRLDGLPLALELAAPRLKIMSPAALLARLEKRLDLLAARVPDAPERHQTLRNTVDWSYALLPAAEQALFRRLAVFAGGCTLEAAEAVCGGELERIASLVNKSLLVPGDGPDGEPRFRLLETLREFAAEQLRASGEEAALYDAHARYVAAFVERAEPHLWGPEQARWIPLMLAEQDNVRQALRWHLDRGTPNSALQVLWRLGHFWWTLGQVAEVRRWAEEALQAGDVLDPLARARAAHLVGYTALAQGDYAPAGPALREALALFRDQHDADGIGRTLVVLGFMRPWEGDLAGGSALLEEAEAVLRQAGAAAAWRHSLCLSGLGCFALIGGDLDDAEDLYRRALAIARQIGDRRSTAHALEGLGSVAVQRGDHARAATLYREGLPQALESGHLELLGYGLKGLAFVAAANHALARAARLLGAADALWETAGVVIWPIRATFYASLVDGVRRQLGDSAYAAAIGEGSRMALPELVRYALEGSPPAAWVVDQPARSAEAPQPLSAREREVAARIAQGLTSKEIAALLVVSEKTVDTHADHIRTKLNLRSRAEIAAWAALQGLRTASSL